MTQVKIAVLHALICIVADPFTRETLFEIVSSIRDLGQKIVSGSVLQGSSVPDIAPVRPSVGTFDKCEHQSLILGV